MTYTEKMARLKSTSCLTNTKLSAEGTRRLFGPTSSALAHLMCTRALQLLVEGPARAHLHPFRTPWPNPQRFSAAYWQRTHSPGQPVEADRLCGMHFLVSLRYPGQQQLACHRHWRVRPKQSMS